VNSGGETRGVDIAVRSGATYTISGVIVDSSTGAAPRRYSVGFARGGGTATMDSPDGSFTLRGLAPGEYTLVATATEEGKPPRRGFVSAKLVDADLRVAIELGRSAEVRGKARTEDGQQFSFANLRLILLSDAEEGVQSSAPFEANGDLTLRGVPPGRYSFQLSGRENEVFVREARCGGEDFLARPGNLEAGQVLDDCLVTLSRDVSECSGQVTEDGKPVEGLVVILIPQEMERRRIPRHTMAAQTDANGHFRIVGVIAGDYFAFAVPSADDAGYYDLEFAERNRNQAGRVHVKSKEPLVLNLKPAKPQ